MTISIKEKERLTKEVDFYLTKYYGLTLNKVKPVSAVILKKWFQELEHEGSHLTSDLIASDIADISQRYNIHI